MLVLTRLLALGETLRLLESFQGGTQLVTLLGRSLSGQRGVVAVVLGGVGRDLCGLGDEGLPLDGTLEVLGLPDLL